MSGVWSRPRGIALGAALLALAGGLGIGPAWWRAPAAVTVLNDVSDSCDPGPEGQPFAHSDLMRAVREAQAKGARRVVLFTDGCDITGAEPTNEGLPVDVVLRPRSDNVGLQEITIPPRIQPGEPFSVRVRVGRSAGAEAPAATVQVRVSRDGEPIGSAQAITLSRGDSRAIAFVDKVPKRGVVHYRAQVEGGPGGEADDLAEAAARVGNRPQIAVVGAHPEWGEQFEISSWRQGGSLDGFDAIVVAEPLADRRDADEVARCVRAGAGLMVLGHDPLLESLLPLTDDPPEGRAVVLQVDVSGSMEKHLPAIRSGFLSLASQLAPNDQVALILFRDQVVYESSWVDATQAHALWKSVPARGNTLLAPAARRAFVMLSNAQARHRRLYVVSDGEWGDGEDAELARLLAENATVHRAALFVSADTPPAARTLFPIHGVASAEAIDAALLLLEQQAPDRRVGGPVNVQSSEAPPWFRGVAPPAASVRDFVRLYPRGVGETVVSAAESIPVVAVRTEGGRIVQAASGAAVGPAALRACVRDDASVVLSAVRDGRALQLRARGSKGAAFVVAGKSIPARAVGSDVWEARLDPAPPLAITVECGGAFRVVPAAASAELSGLHPNAEYAAAIARVSGGRFARDAIPKEWGTESPMRAAASVTLLAAALLVVVAAFFRRGR